MFPIGDDQVKGGHYPIVSHTFIAINFVVFVYQLINPAFTMGYSAIPQEIIHNIDLTENYPLGNSYIPHVEGPWPIYLTLLTSMFMHGGWMHLIGNMMFLWVFGDNIESVIGNFKFLVFYVLAGVVASLAHIFFNSESIIPSLGASGAIAAVMGCYLIMFPKSKIKMFAFIFIFSLPAFLFLGFWIVQQMFNGIGSLNITEGAGVAWWAHIGGFVFGVLAGIIFRSQYKIIRTPDGVYYPSQEKADRFNNRFITNRFRQIN